MRRALLIAAALITASACSETYFSEPLTLGDGHVITAATLNRGRQAYSRFCASCHGHDGRAETSAAKLLDPRPRDFAAAAFKHKTTTGDALPTDADLRQTIKFGVPGTGMPAWTNLTDRDVDALVQYIKVFSPRWQAPRQGLLNSAVNWLPARDRAASFRATSADRVSHHPHAGSVKAPPDHAPEPPGRVSSLTRPLLHTR